MKGSQRLMCELTLRAGKVVYDLNGITRPDWTTLPKSYTQTGDPKWEPQTPEGVTDGLLDAIFAPLPAAEEWKPLR